MPSSYLDETDGQLSIQLLPASLRESVIASRLETTGISPQEIASRLAHLEGRGLVASVPGFREAVWCLTATGRALAYGLKMQQDIQHRYRQSSMFSQDQENP